MSTLEFYLEPTVVEFDGSLFIQKEGVCVGSSRAPLLAEISLNKMDVHVDAVVRFLPSGAVVRRFVDNILLCAFEERLGETVKKCIVDKCWDLTIMEESILQGKIQCLDLLWHMEKGLCWRYSKESTKPLLATDSRHSK